VTFKEDKKQTNQEIPVGPEKTDKVQEAQAADLESNLPEESTEYNSQDTSTDRVAILEAENRECQDKLMRLAAEFENYKKRMTRDRETSLKYAEENILKELLPSIDNLERALDHEQGNNHISTMLEGVELTLKGLLATVNKFGLEPIESVGKAFDPNFHEALAMEANKEVPAQHIIREFEKGYQYKERLLRAAKVVVSKGAD